MSPSERIRGILEGKSPFAAMWGRYASNRLALVGGIILGFFVIVAIFAQHIAPYNPFFIAGRPFLPPGGKFLLGTDNIGRDVFSEFVYGARVSLSVGLTAAFFSTLIGILVGIVSGYFGRYVDDLLMRTTDFFLILPRFFLAMFLVVIFGADYTRMIVIISVLSWPGTARLVRSKILTLKEKEYVLSAKAIGASSFTIMFRELLPNSISPAIVNGSLEVGNAILLESGLSFLGFGDPNNPSWGFMLSNAQGFLSIAWWMALFPGLGILTTVVAANLIGEGINDSLEPKSREWRRGGRVVK